MYMPVVLFSRLSSMARKKIWNEFRRHRIPEQAAALTFYTILAFVPAAAVILVFYQLTGELESLREIVMTKVAAYLLPSAIQEVHMLLEQFIQNVSFSTLGIPGLIVFAITTILLFNSVEDVFYRVRGITHRKNLLWRSLRNLGIAIVGIPATLAVYVTVTGLVPEGMARSVIATLLLSVLVGGIYFFLGRLKFRYAMLGGFTLIIIFGISKLFADYYFSQVLSLNRAIYGSLALLLLLFVWVWVIWILIFTMLLGIRILSAKRRK